MLELPRAEKSLWREAYNRPPYTPLTDELRVDVAVVGAGITGLTVAVLDKDTVGGGTTGRTTGKVTSQHGLIYQELLETIGKDAAKRYGQANEAALDMVDIIIAAEKYLLGLARAVHGNGSYVFEHSKVTGIRDGRPCRVSTHRGRVVSKHIIVATNVPTLPLIARSGYCVLEYPTESYIISGPFDRNLRGMYISPDHNHYSILPIETNGEKRLLIGGGGHLSGLRGSRNRRFRGLADYAEQYFGMTALTHRWSDRDYLAYDKIPLIGKLYPWSKNLYVGTAFKKWGLTGGTLAAMILRDLIAGNTNKWAPVFTPQRLRPVFSIPKAVREQLGQLTKP